MPKITSESREIFAAKSQPYKDKIAESLELEKNILARLDPESSETAQTKLMLSEEMIYVATLYIAINNLSVTLLGTKNNDALNDARKILYRAIIYLEEIVTNVIDISYTEIEDKIEQIASTSISKRYYLIRKLGLAIQLLMEAFGDNSKWRWSFVEIQGRFATVAKNIINWKQASKDYFDSQSDDYDTTVYFVRLVKRLLDQSSKEYRDRYELSTHTVEDMRLAINYVLSSRRLSIIIGNSEESEELKKKATVWKDKVDSDQKKGIAK